jgi:hypothetical protein
VTAAEAVVVDTEITVRARSWRLTKFRNGAIECYAATAPLTLDWTKRRRGAWVKIASATLALACLGPVYELFGQVPYYRPKWLGRWVQSRLSLRRSMFNSGADSL